MYFVLFWVTEILLRAYTNIIYDQKYRYSAQFVRTPFALSEFVKRISIEG